MTLFFFFQAEDGIRDYKVTGVQTCALPIFRRFKTGTTPRVKLSTLELNRTELLDSEPEAGPLSFLHDQTFPQRDLLPCWKTHTSPATHEVIQSHLHESAMYSGQIEGVGPRYCPSIED